MYKGNTRRHVLGAGAGGAVTAIIERAHAGPIAMTAPVETAQGRVRGRRIGDVSSFLGLPYGEDTARCRFQPAKAAASWTGVRDALAYGPWSAPTG